MLVGGRRLDHLNYVCDDPLVKRFCGLLRLPRQRSVARWLKRFTQKSIAALVEINSQIVCEAIEKVKLGRLTLDIDGSVITTGQVWRGHFGGSIRIIVKNRPTIRFWLIWLRPDTSCGQRIGPETSMTPKAQWPLCVI